MSPSSAKANQRGLLDDLALYFQKRKDSEAVTVDHAHGRIETRTIWTTSALNGYLDLPHVGQAFHIQRETIDKKTGKRSHDLAYGITSRAPQQADAQRLLQVNRGHWSIEDSCHYLLDWNYDENRSPIRTSHGPENIARLLRFAIGVIKSATVLRSGTTRHYRSRVPSLNDFTRV